MTTVQGSAQCMVCDALASVGSLGGAFTIVAIVRASSIGVDSMLFGLSTGSTTPYRYSALDSTNVGTAQIVANTTTPNVMPQAGQGSFAPSNAGAITTEDALLIISNNGAQSMAWLNGQQIMGAVGTQDAGTTYTKAVLFGMNYNGSPHPSTFSGKAKRLMIYGRGFSARDAAAVTYAMGWQSYVRFGFNALGDSITAGSVAGPPWANVLTMPTQAIVMNTVSGAVTSRSAIRNGGVAARALATSALAGTNNEAQNAIVDAQAIYMPATPGIITLWMGTNDIYYGGGALTAAQLLARFTAVVAQIRAAAPRAYIIGATILPRGNWETAANYAGTFPPYDTCLSAFNALLLAGFAAAGCDAVWDAASTPGLGVPGTTASPGANYVDACHPTTAGQAALAATYPFATYRTAATNKTLLAMMAGP